MAAGRRGGHLSAEQHGRQRSIHAPRVGAAPRAHPVLTPLRRWLIRAARCCSLTPRKQTVLPTDDER